MFKLLVVLAFCLLGAQAHGYGNRWGGYGSRGMGRWGNRGGYGGGYGGYGGRYGGGYGGFGGKRNGGHRYKRGVDEHDLASHGHALAKYTPDVHHVDVVPASDLHVSNVRGHADTYTPTIYSNEHAANYALTGSNEFLSHGHAMYTPEVKYDVHHVDVVPASDLHVSNVRGHADNYAPIIYFNEHAANYAHTGSNEVLSHGHAMYTPEVKYDVHHVDVVPASDLHVSNVLGHADNYAPTIYSNEHTANYALTGSNEVLSHGHALYTPEVKYDVHHVEVVPASNVYGHADNYAPVIYSNNALSQSHATNYGPVVYSDVQAHDHALSKYTPEVKYDVHHVDVVPASNVHVSNYAPTVYSNDAHGHVSNDHGSRYKRGVDEYDLAVHGQALAKYNAAVKYDGHASTYAPAVFTHDVKSHGHDQYVFSGRHSPVTAGHYVGYGNKYDFRHGYPYGYGEMLGYTTPVGNSLQSGYNKLVTKQPFKYSYNHGYMPLTPVHYNKPSKH